MDVTGTRTSSVGLAVARLQEKLHSTVARGLRACKSSAARSWQTVVRCYSVVDRFFPACGLHDLTEGIYHGDRSVSYDEAQANQHAYLLDQICCGAGSRMLEIGCGYGTLLKRVNKRGGQGVGITLSAEQAAYCKNAGLDVHVLNYRDIPSLWDRSFDGVVANGSIEHFVQPDDFLHGRTDDVYRNLFATVYRMIDPQSQSRRFTTTTIHYIRKPKNPRDMLKSPFRFPRDSDEFHWATLEQGWGGYYPELGQLQRCAAGYFDLVEEVDGTEDYLWTSLEWERRARRALLSPRLFKIVARSLPVAIRSPRQYLILLNGVLACRSWQWQFEGPDPPTRLLRQTWEYRTS